MGSEPHGIIMLLRTNPQWPCSDFFQDFHERRDAGVVRIIGAADQRIGRMLKQISIGVGKSRRFPSRHRMAGQKNWTDFFDKKLGGSLPDSLLRTARIGHERMRRRVMREFRKKIKGHANRQRDVDQVGAANRGLQRLVVALVDRTTLLSFQNNLGTIPTDNLNIGGVLAKGMSKRAPDQSGAEDGYPLDEMGHVK